MERLERKTAAKRWVESRFGPICPGLLSRLQAGKSYQDIAEEWEVHANTIKAWTASYGIRNRKRDEWVMEESQSG